MIIQDVVGVHLRYLQTMMGINQVNNNHGYVLPLPLEIIKIKKSFVKTSLRIMDQIVINVNRNLMDSRTGINKKRSNELK